MKQIIQSYKTGELWLAEVPAPACRTGGVLVETRSSFVSAGTERMLVDFGRKTLLGKALAMPDQVKKVLRKVKAEGLMSTIEKVQAKLDQPIPLGYSCAGIVREVGGTVQELHAGDRVACGGVGYANHAQFNYVPKNLVVRIPEGVSFEDASCATVGSIALQGIRLLDVRLGESVCVIGLGLLGLLAVQMLKASGCRVLGFDPNASRCDLALDLGADLAVSDALEATAEAFSEGRGVDAVLITAATKSNEPVTVAGEIARHKGRVVVTGMVGMEIPRDQYYKKELEFKLSLSYGPGRYDSQYEEGGQDYPYGYVRWTEQRNIRAFLDLVAQGNVTPSKLITHRFDIDRALDAYELLLGRGNEPYLGIVINYPEQPPQSPKQRIEIREIRQSKPRGNGQVVHIGLVGAGNFAKGVLLPVLKKQDGIELTGVCAASSLNTGETARRYGFAYGTTDAADLIRDDRITALLIATPHNSHARYTCEALKAGRHVFVEKPLAVDRSQLEHVVSAWGDLGDRRPVLTVGFNRRFSPHAAMIRDYFKARSGPMVVNYRVNAGTIRNDHWVQDLSVGGGRIIGEVCHFVDFASFVVGSLVCQVQTMGVTTNRTADVPEDNVLISLKYHDGSVANIVYVAVGSPDLPKERCEVFATGSVAVMEDFRTTRCFGKLGRRRLSGKQRKGFSEEMESFVRGIRSGDLPIGMESLINTTLTTFAIADSVRMSQAVCVDS